MKSLLITLIFLFPGLIYSQEFETMTKKEQKQLAKEQKIANRIAREEKQKKEILYMLENHRFVLEANYIGDGKGNKIPVTSAINFISVDSNNAVIQIGSPSGIGWNGVGGVTANGSVSKYDLKIKEGKKGNSYNLSIIVMSSLGTYDVSFMITGFGNTEATVRSISRGQLNYYGYLISPAESRIFKGSTTY